MIESVYRMAATTLSLITICVLGVFGDIDSVEFHRGVMAVRTESTVGFTFGGLIALNSLYPDEWLDHEYGHILQERQLGPAYLPIVGVVSLSWNVYRLTVSDADPYESLWIEQWANELGSQ